MNRRDLLKSMVLTAMAAAVHALFPRKLFAAPPIWAAIPDQTWYVGVPVYLDLANYVTDPESDPLTFTLSNTLPPGVGRDGSVISGTPNAVFAATDFVATADDGEATDELAPAAPTGLIVE